jgi:putative component of membrane protein insertase Oxa1/YidC/SpoIIIJ protein YidD
MSRLLLAAIRGYRYLLSPWWGGQCRFTPTCSEYAMDAIREHGSLARLVACHAARHEMPPVAPRRFRPGALSPEP